jgi:hypothetical protein
MNRSMILGFNHGVAYPLPLRHLSLYRHFQGNLKFHRGFTDSLHDLNDL